MRYANNTAISLAICLGLCSPALANNVGENYSWRFQTTADKVNQAAVQDMIRKRKGGYYSAPVYTTNIDRQYNCNVTASAQGNQGTNATTANSPKTDGAKSDATGNANSSDVASGFGGDGGANSNQDNTGPVGSSVWGGTSTNVNGWASQALNSEQTNSGNQNANVSGSTGCKFAGVLN
jgi:hypothetical protein